MHTSPQHPSYQQRGVAIIMVLLIVALATSMAAYMASQQNWWYRQVENQLDKTQARRVGIAAIDWARAILAEDKRVSDTDHESELWTTELPAVPVENGEVIGIIEDRQGRFNLNNLVKSGKTHPQSVAQFKNLLALLDLPPELALALADWIDKDTQAQFPGGAEDVHYLGQQHPYRTANDELVELNELLLIKGFDQQTIARVKPFVTVLPGNTSINVNFAPAEVLAAMIEGLSLADARTLVQLRKSEPFKDIDDFKKRLPNPELSFSTQQFGVSSQFFWVSGKATMGDSLLYTQALLKRENKWPHVIWQSIQ